MRTVIRHGAQGDVMFIRVQKLPENIKLKESNSEVIVAHSETDHHHVAVADKIRLYGTSDPMVCYLVNETGKYMDIIHQRPFNTHETLRLIDGPWKVIRARESTPQGWRPITD